MKTNKINEKYLCTSSHHKKLLHGCFMITYHTILTLKLIGQDYNNMANTCLLIFVLT